jgi:hypothetical protein
MIYEDWQNEFSKMMRVLYHCLKEIGEMIMLDCIEKKCMVQDMMKYMKEKSK